MSCVFSETEDHAQTELLVLKPPTCSANLNAEDAPRHARQFMLVRSFNIIERDRASGAFALQMGTWSKVGEVCAVVRISD